MASGSQRAAADAAEALRAATAELVAAVRDALGDDDDLIDDDSVAAAMMAPAARERLRAALARAEGAAGALPALLTAKSGAKEEEEVRAWACARARFPSSVGFRVVVHTRHASRSPALL
jgi:enamine deaminase RidA (YjgF/YER057c/UK114 family)